MRTVLRALAVVSVFFTSLTAQDAVITPPPSAQIEGMPALPASIAEALATYEFRQATVQSWHPTRRELLVTTRFGNVQQVHLVRKPGGARTQMTFRQNGVPMFSAAWFTPDGTSMMLRTDATSGGARYQFSRLELATNKITLLTDGRSRHGLPVWSHKGDRIAYDSMRRNNTDRDLFVMDPADLKSERQVSQVEGSWVVLDWAPDDRSLLAVQTISPSQNNLWRVDVATGEKTRITPDGGPPTVYNGGRFSRDGRAVYALTELNSEFRRLARLDLSTGKWTTLTDDTRDVDEFALSPDGRTIAVSLNADPGSELRLIDAATGKARPLPKIPSGVIARLQWHPRGAEVAFDVESTRVARDVVSLNVTTGVIDRWTTSEVGEVNPELLIEPELIRWKSFDGRTISGVLYRPPSRFTGKRPAMINFHGGPEQQYRLRWQGRSNYLLNELGLAIIYPNVRGSTGFGKTFRELDNREKREDATKDVGALLDWIATQPELDKDRVMVTGGSYGGYLALASAAMYPDRVRCASSGFGPTNLVTELQTMQTSAEIRRYEYGDENDPKTREFLLRISPVTNAGKIKVPVHLAQGLNDPRVPPGQALEMSEALKKNGTPLWVVSFKDEGHDLTRQVNADFNFYAWIGFVQKYLLPEKPVKGTGTLPSTSP